ncbi:MAG: transglutaminase-like domain-containing protein, partial [Anaerolineales bacterium]
AGVRDAEELAFVGDAVVVFVCGRTRALRLEREHDVGRDHGGVVRPLVCLAAADLVTHARRRAVVVLGVLKVRVEVQELRVDVVRGRLEDLDLEKAVLLLAFWNSSRVDLPAIVNELDEIAGEIRKSIPTTGHPLSFIDTVSEFLNKNMGFRGNSTDYYNPDNSFIDKVLKTKTGIPITLSTIYILIARRIDLPILGVPMPAHFIVKYDDGTDEIFFDPFYGGKVYSRQECLKYLEQADIEDHNKVLDGCSNFDIILRMMRNIHLVYSSYKDEPQKITEIEQLLSLVEQNFK